MYVRNRGFLPVPKLLYSKQTYQNLDNATHEKIQRILEELHKESYALKRLTERTHESPYPFLSQDSLLIIEPQQPCIVVTKNAIFINQSNILHLSDEALKSALLYEIHLIEKNIYIKQLIISLSVALVMNSLIIYSGLAYTVSGVVLSLLNMVFFVWMMEHINFAQKKASIKQLFTNNNLRGFKEYLDYLKSYLDRGSDVKYDISKQLNFISTLKPQENSKLKI